MSGRRFVGQLDGTTDRVVTKGELDGVQTIATNAASAAAVKADWNAAGGSDAEILNKPAIPGVIDTLDSSSTTDALSANQGRELSNRIDGFANKVYAADLAARDALTGLQPGDIVQVADDGDGKWARYEVTSTTDGTGANSTFMKIMDEDVFGAINGGTDLGVTADASTQSITSSSGTDATLATASGTTAGVITGATYTELHDRNKAIPIPGDGSTVTFSVSIGYTDDAVNLDLFETASNEYVDVKLVRAKNSATVTVGPFATPPPNNTAYELHVVRG